MPPPRHVFDPTQPLPRLTLDARWRLDRAPGKPGLLPGRLALDPSVENTLHRMTAGDIVIGTAQTFPRSSLDDIKNQFKPKVLEGGMGCMLACYGVLDILYTGPVAKALQKEVYKRALAKAEAYAKRNPDELKQKIADAKAADPKLTDAQARKQVLNEWTSPHNTSDHLFALMGEEGLADKKVNSPNAKAEQTIRSLTGDLPGVYFFGLAVRDNHTVTLAVERAADGSQKMYWLDQNKPGLSREIKAGELGGALKNVPGYTTSTNIYPFRPPSNDTSA